MAAVEWDSLLPRSGSTAFFEHLLGTSFLTLPHSFIFGKLHKPRQWWRTHTAGRNPGQEHPASDTMFSFGPSLPLGFSPAAPVLNQEHPSPMQSSQAAGLALDYGHRQSVPM
jgi:hypothetical protein